MTTPVLADPYPVKIVTAYNGNVYHIRGAAHPDYRRAYTLCGRDLIVGFGMSAENADKATCKGCRTAYEDTQMTEPKMTGREQRSICQHCGRGIHRENSSAPWTCPIGPGLSGDTDECHAAPNPDDGPMPGHKPGFIATKAD